MSFLESSSESRSGSGYEKGGKDSQEGIGLGLEHSLSDVESEDTLDKSINFKRVQKDFRGKNELYTGNQNNN